MKRLCITHIVLALLCLMYLALRMRPDQKFANAQPQATWRAARTQS